MSAFDSFPAGDVEIRMDGLPVEVPRERRSLAAIRSFLELLALQQQRVLCSLNVNGESIPLTQAGKIPANIVRVEAESMSLSQMPLQIIKAALQQTNNVRTRIQSSVELVLINSPQQSRELWWGLATQLKEPLLTLSLLPEDICGPANGRASLIQLRMWQLQQLGCIIQEVDEAARSDDPTVLSEALEKRALAWVNNLHESIRFWHEAIAGDTTPACQSA